MGGLAYSTPAVLGVPGASKRGRKTEEAPMWVGWLHLPCRLWGSQTFQSAGQNQKWPTCGRVGYITLAVWEVPNASKRGRNTKEAHKKADWLHHPCSWGGGGSPMLQSGGQNQKWPTKGRVGPKGRNNPDMPKKAVRSENKQFDFFFWGTLALTLKKKKTIALTLKKNTLFYIYLFLLHSLDTSLNGQ